MKQILVIPKREKISDYINLAQKYDLGFEYNDFFVPDILDEENECERIVQAYKQELLPAYTTMHGAFFDVIPVSVDAKIREISRNRIEQSIEIAKRIGVKAVIFHTNYNPSLNSPEYVDQWIDTNADFWRNVLDRHADINIYLENMFETTPDVLKGISEQLQQYPNYGVCLDWAHVHVYGHSYETWIESLAPYIKHIHINDNDLITDLHLPLGTGKINWEQFFTYYNNYFQNCSILIEINSPSYQKHSLDYIKNKFHCI